MSPKLVASSDRLTIHIPENDIVAELMGDGLIVVDQAEPGRKMRQRVVLTEDDLELLLAKLRG